jgi:hypothetical protein
VGDGVALATRLCELVAAGESVTPHPEVASKTSRPQPSDPTDLPMASANTAGLRCAQGEMSVGCPRRSGRILMAQGLLRPGEAVGRTSDARDRRKVARQQDRFQA